MPSETPFSLTAAQARVLGALLEKEATNTGVLPALVECTGKCLQSAIESRTCNGPRRRRCAAGAAWSRRSAPCRACARSRWPCREIRALAGRSLQLHARGDSARLRTAAARPADTGRATRTHGAHASLRRDWRCAGRFTEAHGARAAACRRAPAPARHKRIALRASALRTGSRQLRLQPRLPCTHQARKQTTNVSRSSKPQSQRYGRKSPTCVPGSTICSEISALCSPRAAEK